MVRMLSVVAAKKDIFTSSQYLSACGQVIEIAGRNLLFSVLLPAVHKASLLFLMFMHQLETSDSHNLVQSNHSQDWFWGGWGAFFVCFLRGVVWGILRGNMGCNNSDTLF